MKNYVVALIAGISAIVCFCLLGSAYKYKFKAQENIVVTGLAEKDFVSDQIVWKGTYSRASMNLEDAYASLKQDEKAVIAYLSSKGITPAEMVVSAVDISKESSSRYDNDGKYIGQVFAGYNLSQKVTIDSKDIDKVELLSRSATELIEKGIEFNSSSPSYFYSKLSELKVDLLSKASEDARSRASSIAENAKGKLGDIRKANMGVFQITGKNANDDYSYGGTFNTSSKIKTASITVRMEFAAN